MAKLKKIIIIIASFFIIFSTIGFFIGKSYYDKIFAPNTVKIETAVYVYIPTGSNFDDVCKIFENSGYIKNMETFRFVAGLKNYKEKIYAGKYKLTKTTSNNELINNLRSNRQEMVKLSFISLRSLDILAKKLSIFLEPDSIEFSQCFKNYELISKIGFTKETFITLFIPNTYEFYWNTSAEKFLERMSIEYKNFWNTERQNKANLLKLTQIEVSILASIVEEETQKNDEKSRISGVYINRLNKGMPLQADPTVKFAVGDVNLTRILNRHLEIDSPYNTYKHAGLPPGPICIPSISSIDAVLNYEKHNYLYFCAKPDFSGYHNFANTLTQHNIYATQYHNALKKIK